MGSLCLALNEIQQAYSYFERGADMAHKSGDIYQEALSLLNLGNVLVNAGNLTEGAQHHRRAAALFTAIGDTATVAVVQICLSGAASGAGDYAQAEALLTEALATHRRHKARVQEAIALYYLGRLALWQQQTDLARERFRDSLKLLWEAEVRQRVAVLLSAFAWLAQVAGEMERAAQLFGASAELFARIGAGHQLIEQPEYDQVQEVVRAALGNERFTLLWEEGGAWDEAAAVSYALRGFLPDSKSSC